MIAQVNSVAPVFGAINISKTYMRPEQERIANKINKMLVSSKFKDKNGKTLEEQAGEKADIYISQPSMPYQKTSDKKSVDVFITYSQYIDDNGEKFGERNVYQVGRFNHNNISSFVKEFKSTNNKNNPANLENKFGCVAIALGILACLSMLVSRYSETMIDLLKKL